MRKWTGRYPLVTKISLFFWGIFFRDPELYVIHFETMVTAKYHCHTIEKNELQNIWATEKGANESAVTSEKLSAVEMRECLLPQEWRIFLQIAQICELQHYQIAHNPTSINLILITTYLYHIYKKSFRRKKL